jgi:hypothetical protein
MFVILLDGKKGIPVTRGTMTLVDIIHIAPGKIKGKNCGFRLKFSRFGGREIDRYSPGNNTARPAK